MHKGQCNMDKNRFGMWISMNYPRILIAKNVFADIAYPGIQSLMDHLNFQYPHTFVGTELPVRKLKRKFFRAARASRISIVKTLGKVK